MVGIAGRTIRPGIRFRKKKRPLTGQIRERWALKVGVDLVDLGGAVDLHPSPFQFGGGKSGTKVLICGRGWERGGV